VHTVCPFRGAVLMEKLARAFLDLVAGKCPPKMAH